MSSVHRTQAPSLREARLEINVSVTTVIFCLKRESVKVRKTQSLSSLLFSEVSSLRQEVLAHHFMCNLVRRTCAKITHGTRLM